MATAHELMYTIVANCEEANQLARSMLGTAVVFGDVSGGYPKLAPAELGFLRCVSWLFRLLFEAGRLNVQFLMGRRIAYHLDESGALKEILELIQKLRTYTQHNLNPLEPHDGEIIKAAEKWISAQSGTAVPYTEDQWEKCLIALLDQARILVEGLMAILRRIESDNDRLTICADWRFRLDRHHEPHEFDVLIPEVATDMGHEFLDPVPLRKRYYDKWVSKLRTLSDSYDFKIEGRRLIEAAILAERREVLPITALDLINVLNIPPGPEVGRLLQRAKDICSLETCTRDVLLDRLRLEIGQEKGNA